MTTNMTTNGQSRKTLASQLDRLDTILDTLEQGLQEAVASAVQEAVGVAVREAIKGLVTEVLTNPDVLGRIRALIAPVIVKNTPKPTDKLQAAVKERFGRLWSSIKGRVEAAKQACGQVLRRISQWTGKLLSRLRVLAQFKSQLLLSLGGLRPGDRVLDSRGVILPKGGQPYGPRQTARSAQRATLAMLDPTLEEQRSNGSSVLRPPSPLTTQLLCLAA